MSMLLRHDRVSACDDRQNAHEAHGLLLPDLSAILHSMRVGFQSQNDQRLHDSKEEKT